MGYRRDLDEYSDEELVQELNRREALRAIGKCDYCQRASNTAPCRFVKRHQKSLQV